jgi:hypothetical protein
MLKIDDLQQFKEFLASGGWADAFGHAEHELRLEMLEKIEELLDAADVADRVVGQVLFSQEGMSAPGPASSPLKKE